MGVPGGSTAGSIRHQYCKSMSAYRALCPEGTLISQTAWNFPNRLEFPRPPGIPAADRNFRDRLEYPRPIGIPDADRSLRGRLDLPHEVGFSRRGWDFPTRLIRPNPVGISQRERLRTF